jgi:hypothetical protein
MRRRIVTAVLTLAGASGNVLAAQTSDSDPVTCGRAREESLASDIARVSDAVALVRAAAKASGVDSVGGIVHVSPDVGVRVIGSNLPQSVADALADSLLARVAARRTAVNSRYSTLLLRLDPLPLPACGPRARRESLPRTVNVEMMPSVLRDIAIAGRAAFPARGRGLMRIVISRDAEVVSAQVLSDRSPEILETGILEIARRLRFRAAALDGVPVDVVLFIPVSF